MHEYVKGTCRVRYRTPPFDHERWKNDRYGCKCYLEVFSNWHTIGKTKIAYKLNLWEYLKLID